MSTICGSSWFGGWLVWKAGRDAVFVRLGPVELDWELAMIIDAIPVIVGSAVILFAVYAWITMQRRA